MVRVSAIMHKTKRKGDAKLGRPGAYSRAGRKAECEAKVRQRIRRVNFMQRRKSCLPDKTVQSLFSILRPPSPP